MRTVVTFADGAGNYLKQMARLENSLRQTGFEGNIKTLNDYGHIGSKLHNEVPYQFKAFSIEKARQEFGGLILWCDSPVYAKKNIDAVFKYIEKNGFLFFDNIGYSVGDYTSDICLKYFAIDRNQAFEIQMVMACVMGFDFSNPKANEIFEEYLQLAKEEETYMGSWTNVNAEVSSDLRCKGHRHDQSVISLILHKHGIKPLHAQSTFFAYETHRQVMPISETVCLFSQGI